LDVDTIQIGPEQIPSIAEDEPDLSDPHVTTFPRREEELRTPVQRLFPSERYLCGNEVPFGLKRIDLVFRQRNNNQEIVAVELKLRKWRKAVWQATANRQIATYSYVALPSHSATAIDKQLLVSLGLGLIVTDSGDNARIVLPAKRSRYVNRRIALEISNLLAGNQDV
jgi:hypothetical protein